MGVLLGIGLAILLLWAVRCYLIASLLIGAPLVVVLACCRVRVGILLVYSMLIMFVVVWVDSWFDPHFGYYGRFAQNLGQELYRSLVYPFMLKKYIGGGFLYDTWYYLYSMDVVSRISFPLWAKTYLPGHVVPLLLAVALPARLVVYPLLYLGATWWVSPSVSIYRGGDINEHAAAAQMYHTAEGIPPAFISRIVTERVKALRGRVEEEIAFMRKVREYKKERARRD